MSAFNFAETQKRILNAITDAGLLEEWRAYHRALGSQDRILHWMELQRKPVLLSHMRHALADKFDDDAFEHLRRSGVIVSVAPEAVPGNSGRQFWDFAHMTAVGKPA